MNFSALKSRQQQMWGTGDYGAVAIPIVIVSELLCESLDLRAGWSVLDVACGTGNTSIAAARRRCRVTGVDYVEMLLERARQRAAAERLLIEFREADAEALPFEDGSFDAVASTFGAMFAPDQHKAAGELLRTCRAGGKIGMANWTPDGFVGEWFRISSRYMPALSGGGPQIKPPVLWGTESHVRELFGDGVASLSTTQRTFVLRYESVATWFEFFRTNFGPTRTTFGSLDPAGQKSFAGELMDLAQRFNRSGDETMVVPADYLEVIVTRR
jgi:SAM-dependent methyltransferase